MVQLHDSRPGTGRGGARPAGFRRVFGIETEYGVSVTGVAQDVEAGTVAREMFRPVYERVGGTNTYTANGSRLYLDVGAHPEYATAEAARPRDAALVDTAGERVMRSLAAAAQDALRGTLGEGARVHVYKNNVDSAGHSFGCHENYMIPRAMPLSALSGPFVSFLVTRTLYTGAGAWDARGVFRLSQRAPFLDEAVSSATTRARPMINTRDEPLADSHVSRRLHVIVGDSNRSRTATWMKLATAHLVLCALEEGARRDDGEGRALEGLALSDPGRAIRTVASDMTGRAPLDLADGRRMSALDIQAVCLDAARALAAAHHGEPGMEEADACLARWQDALDAVGRGDIDSLASWVDWAAKWRLSRSLLARHPGLDAARLRQIDLDYHDVAAGRAYDSLVSHGLLSSPFGDEAEQQAVCAPPADTRAAIRGAFVRRALDSSATWSAEWTGLAVQSPSPASVELLDPLQCVPDARVEAVFAALDSPAAPAV